MIGDTLLFGRVATVEIQDPNTKIGKEFSYPPFRIEFDVDFDTFNTTTIRLTNPNQDTIDSVQSKKKGKQKLNAIVNLSAGYKDENGLVVSGEAYDYKVKREGENKILEMKVSERIGSWGKTPIFQQYSKMDAKGIFQDVCKRGNLTLGKIELGEKLSCTFYAGYLKEAIEKLCQKTQSEYSFADGKINISPKSPEKQKSVMLLDYEGGLIGIPEKNGNKTWKVRSIFRHTIRKSMIISIQGGDLDADVRVLRGKMKFSSHSPDSYVEMEVVEL